MNPRRSFRKATFGLLVISLALVGPVLPAFGWGSLAHGLLTEAACDRLPEPLATLYRANRDFLACYSVIPDRWWGNKELMPLMPKGLEDPSGVVGFAAMDHHHVMVDSVVYSSIRKPRGEVEFLPITREEAKALFAKYVQQNPDKAKEEIKRDIKFPKKDDLPGQWYERSGQLQWVTTERLDDLVKAMKAGDWKRALFLSTVVGHFVGDVYTPLHNTRHHNGQYHPNPMIKKVHSRWESGLIQNYEKEVRQSLAEGTKASSTTGAVDSSPKAVTAAVFRHISESYRLADQIYADDDEILKGFYPTPVAVDENAVPEDTKVYSKAYYDKFFERQGKVAMDRLNGSADFCAYLWRVAWERAGKPKPPEGFIVDTKQYIVDWRSKTIKPYDPKVGSRD